jgi:hypothetical protein
MQALRGRKTLSAKVRFDFRGKSSTPSLGWLKFLIRNSEGISRAPLDNRFGRKSLTHFAEKPQQRLLALLL